MGPRLRNRSLSPGDRYSERKIIAREVEPCPDKRIRDHIFLILEVKETFPTTPAQKGSLEVIKGSDVNLPIGLFTRIHLSQRCACTDGRTLR